MFNNPKITFSCVTYNRHKMLRNLLLSFVKTNEYDNFEWIVLHHDCTDDTENYLNSIIDDSRYSMLKGKLTIIKGYESEYLTFLKNKSIDVSTAKKAQFSHFPKWRNTIIEQMQGKIMIDIPDDHQFIWKGDYCKDIIDVFNDRIEKLGNNDISTLTFRTRFGYRILKPNNKKSKLIKTKSGVGYFTIDTKKTHDEWHAIAIDNFKKIDYYPQLEKSDITTKNNWNNSEFYFFHHESMKKSFFEHGLKRAVLLAPITHDCLDEKYKNLGTSDECIFHIFSSKSELNKHIGKHYRPLAIYEYENISKIMKSL